MVTIEATAAGTGAMASPRPAAQRDLLLVAAGTAVSTAGDAAAMVALLLRMRPHGSVWVAALLAAELLPTVLLAPLVGRLVDRAETWRTILLALVGQTAIAVPLALVSGPLPTVLLFGGMFVFGSVLRPASSAFVPAVTGPQDAPRGYRMVATGGGLGWIVGPGLGGALTGAFGPSVALLVDAASFAAMAAAVGFVRARRRSERDGATIAGREPGGLRIVWSLPVLRLVVVVGALAVGCAVVDNVAAPFRYVNELHASAGEYGVYLTIWSAGALVGVRLSARIADRWRVRGVLLADLGQGLAIAGIGLLPSLGWTYGASALGGVANGVANVLLSALVASMVPSARHGRAFAATGAMTQVAVGAGTVAGAPLITALGGGGAMGLAGCLAAVAAAIGTAGVWIFSGQRAQRTQ